LDGTESRAPPHGLEDTPLGCTVVFTRIRAGCGIHQYDQALAFSGETDRFMALSPHTV
jgi:hypothetical protein